MWFTVGAVAAFAAGVWLISGAMLWILLILTLVLGITLFFTPWKPGKLAGWILAGCAFGLCWMFAYEQLHMLPAKACDDRYMDLSITVSDYALPSENGTAAQGTVQLQGRKYSVKFYLNEQVILEPGDTVEGTFYMRYTGFDGVNSATYHQGKGIMLLAYAEKTVRVLDTGPYYSGFWTQKLRQSIKTLLDRLFPEDTAGFAKALLLGDSSDISTADDRALQVSGIRHVIAVSGLHISILFSFLQLMLGKRKWLTGLIGLPILLLFAVLAGFTPSVIRACIMQMVLIIAGFFQKEYDSLTALSLAVLVILCINPLTMTNVSFQLSVGSVLGILLFSGRVQKWIMARKWLKGHHPDSVAGKIVKWFASSIAVSASALIFTLPLCANYFGAFSTVSVITNLLTLWIITYIFCGLLICCIIGAVYAPLAVALAAIISWPMRYVLWTARVISCIPYACVSTDSVYVVVWLLFVYALVLIHCLLKYNKPMITASCALVSLCLVLTLTAVESAASHFEVMVLDVGQGQCVVFRSGDGCYVVDCGGDNGTQTANMVTNTLQTRGIDKIDGLILTHFDGDHVGGAYDLMDQMTVDRLYMPDADPEEPFRVELEQAYAEKIHWVRGNRYLSFGDAEISIYSAEHGAMGNESSLCILFQSENCDILITGDKHIEAEQALLKSVRLPQLDVLITGHHGAPNSTSMELLDATKPKAAVISVGAQNRYGHPAQTVLDRLEMFGCQIWRTDQHGTIIFRG